MAPETKFSLELGRIKKASRKAQQIGKANAHAKLQIPIPICPVKTTNDLPPANTQRWVTRRKAEVVSAVKQGLISLAEACERYNLSVDEFVSWQQGLKYRGLEGLMTTKTRKFRRPHHYDNPSLSARISIRSYKRNAG